MSWLYISTIYTGGFDVWVWYAALQSGQKKHLQGYTELSEHCPKSFLPKARVITN